MQKLLTINEVAEFLGVKPQTVYKYKSEKVIPFYMVGKNVRFDYDEIKAWLNKNHYSAK